MDIQKERQEFELLPDIRGIIQDGFQFNSELNQYFHLDHVNHRLSYAFLMGAWQAWLAAKVQAVPEANALLGATLDAVQKLGSGDFVLVPVIDIELAIEALDEAGEGESKYYAGCADGLRKALESLEKNNGN